MPSIRIINTPRGEAPLWVREAWVGLTLPLSITGYTEIGRGVLSKQKSFGGFMTPTFHALRILETKNAEAAKWWQNLLVEIDAADCLVFNDEACEYIEADLSSLN